MSNPPSPGRRSSWWLWMHAIAVVLVMSCEYMAMTVTFALPVPLFIGLRLAQGMGAVLGGPWSLSYLVPLVPPVGSRVGALVALGTPMLLNLALHVVLTSWFSRRRKSACPDGHPGLR